MVCLADNQAACSFPRFHIAQPASLPAKRNDLSCEAPPGHTWWPVTEVVLKKKIAEALHGKDQDRTVVDSSGQLRTKFRKVVVCFYQWQESTPMGWMIEG